MAAWKRILYGLSIPLTLSLSFWAVKFLKAFSLLGTLVGSTMSLNGEDKENILQLFFCEPLAGVGGRLGTRTGTGGGQGGAQAAGVGYLGGIGRLGCQGLGRRL